MSKVICKGTKWQRTVSMSLTDVAQAISIEHSGSKAETFDSTTLDGGVYKTKDHTGYAEGGTVSIELFYDPALSGHQAITDQQATPADNANKIIYADTSEQAFTSAGIGFGVTVAMNDGLKGTVEIEVDGDPGWKT